MSFDKAYSEELKAALQVLARKDRPLWVAVFKKMSQIASLDEESIEHFKNLKHGLSDYKRVHVGGSYVLFFTIIRKKRIIFFDKLLHHDDAYRR